MPAFVPVDCVELITRMIRVNPEERYTLAEVKKHKFFTKNAGESPELPLRPVIQFKDLSIEGDLNEDVINSMTSLGCFRDRQKLIKKLVTTEKNTEKVIYFLLLDRKVRVPAKKDDESSLLYVHTPGKTLFSSIIEVICKLFLKCIYFLYSQYFALPFLIMLLFYFCLLIVI